MPTLVLCNIRKLQSVDWHQSTNSASRVGGRGERSTPLALQKFLFIMIGFQRGGEWEMALPHPESRSSGWPHSLGIPAVPAQLCPFKASTAALDKNIPLIPLWGRNAPLLSTAAEKCGACRVLRLTGTLKGQHSLWLQPGRCFLRGLKATWNRRQGLWLGAPPAGSCRQEVPVRTFPKPAQPVCSKGQKQGVFAPHGAKLTHHHHHFQPA